MARRVDHSHEELRELILSATQNLVEKSGYAALSARKIANKIGYSPGTIYNVFANLDELILQLNANTLDELYFFLSGDPVQSREGDFSDISGRPHAKDTHSVAENLNLLLNRYLIFIEQNKNLWRLLFEHKPSSEQALPDWYNVRVSKLLETIDNTLEPIFRGREPGALRKASATLWASLHGIISLADSGKLEVVSNVSPSDMCKFLVRNFLVGLAESETGSVSGLGVDSEEVHG